MHTNITRTSTDDFTWSHLKPIITVLKIPLRLFGLLDTRSFRPTRRLERIIYAIALICFSMLVFQLVSDSNNAEIGHFNVTLALFLGYTIMFITTEIEWLRIRSNLGDNIYKVSTAISEVDRLNINLEDRMNLNNNDNINIVNDPYKPHPTLIDLVIQGGFAVAAAIVKVGGVKIHNPEFGNASQWYKSLWKEIALEMDSRHDQIVYALTRSYEAAMIVFHDGKNDSCGGCGDENCICKRKNSS